MVSSEPGSVSQEIREQLYGRGETPQVLLSVLMGKQENKTYFYKTKM